MSTKFTMISSIRPSMKLALEIEEELGGIAPLASRLAEGRWGAGELVTLIQILLQGAGQTTDWLALGDGMIAEGLSGYAAAALHFLSRILDGAKP